MCIRPPPKLERVLGLYTSGPPALRCWLDEAEAIAIANDTQPDDGRAHVYFFFHAFPEQP